MRNNLSSWASIATLALFLLPATLAASAQKAPPDRPSTDAEKIADALRAGPRFITKDATLLDWPSTPDGEYRVLRQGTNEWTCLPGVPGYPHDEPGCFDPTFMQWMKDSLAGRLPHIDRVGISYMYAGRVGARQIGRRSWVNDQRVSCGSAYHDRKPTSESA